MLRLNNTFIFLSLGITIGIEDDDIPEDDEVIIVQLSEPQGGAVLAKVHKVQIKIQANDHVAGVLSFKQPTHLVKEGKIYRNTYCCFNELHLFICLFICLLLYTNQRQIKHVFHTEGCKKSVR